MSEPHTNRVCPHRLSLELKENRAACRLLLSLTTFLPSPVFQARSVIVCSSLKVGVCCLQASHWWWLPSFSAPMGTPRSGVSNFGWRAWRTRRRSCGDRWGPQRSGLLWQTQGPSSLIKGVHLAMAAEH